MSNYFLLASKHIPQVASAYAPNGTKLAHELIVELNDVDKLPFEFELFALYEGKNGLTKSKSLEQLKVIWLDYQPNSLAWPLVSKSLKQIIEKHLTGNEGIDWITANITGVGEKRTYYIPRFKKMLDVLDLQKTVFISGTTMVIVPNFSLSKISNFSIFHQPSAPNLWKITAELYVSEILKKAIQKEKLTGISFEKIAVT